MSYQVQRIEREACLYILFHNCRLTNQHPVQSKDNPSQIILKISLVHCFYFKPLIRIHILMIEHSLVITQSLNS